MGQVFCRMCCTKPRTNTVMRALELSFPTTRRISNQPWPVKMVLVVHMTNLKIFVLSVFSFNTLKLVSTQSIIKIKKDIQVADVHQAPVVHRVDNVIYRINRDPVDKF